MSERKITTKVMSVTTSTYEVFMKYTFINIDLWTAKERKTQLTMFVSVLSNWLAMRILILLHTTYANPDISEKLRDAYVTFNQLLNIKIREKPSILYSGESGRPKFDICQENASLYIEYGFSYQKIGGLLNVSKETVYRRTKEFGIKALSHSDISDEELTDLMLDIILEFRTVEKSWSSMEQFGRFYGK